MEDCPPGDIPYDPVMATENGDNGHHSYPPVTGFLEVMIYNNALI